MDVQLYVYDLSKGLARQMSMAFLGVQIDAVYHTSLVFGNIEYFFGAGVQTCYPGSTHHGQPMEKIALGRTDLPLEVILEYLESLKEIYTAESYDLFMHNCNNFSNDFAIFLVGKGIPSHITSLPQRVLDTPFGQMLKPQLDQAMRGITQAPVPPSNVPRPAQTSRSGQLNGKPAVAPSNGKVHSVSSLSQIQTLLRQAENSCAVIFFTSSTCAPCKICYQPYDDLAEEHAGKATLIKVDINIAMEVGSHYNVRATPTFMTFLKGQKHEEWSGAVPSTLNNNVNLLVQMAHPAHVHRTLRVPTLQKPYRPDLYTAVPPLEKLIIKLGPLGKTSEVQALQTFVQKRYKESAADAPLPNLKAIAEFAKSQTGNGHTDSLFALIDLLRVAAVDPRVSGYFVEDGTSAIWKIMEAVCDWDADASNATKLVTVQLACNMFSSPLMNHHLDKGDQALTRLGTWLLLDEKSSAKIKECAATLMQNIAKAVHSQKLEDRPVSLAESYQVELAVALLESIQRNEETDMLKRSTLALGLLAFMCPQDGELKEILIGMEASSIVSSAGGVRKAVDKSVVDDVVKVLS